MKVNERPRGGGGTSSARTFTDGDELARAEVDHLVIDVLSGTIALAYKSHIRRVERERNKRRKNALTVPGKLEWRPGGKMTERPSRVVLTRSSPSYMKRLHW